MRPTKWVCAHEIDVIGQHHEIARVEFFIDASRCIRQQQVRDAKCRERPHRERHALHRMPLVKMRAPAQDQHRRFAEMTKIQFTRVAADGRLGKAGDFGVGNCRRHAQFGEDVMKSAAEHDGELRAQRGNFFEPRGGGLWAGGRQNFHGLILPESNLRPKKLFLRRNRLHMPLDARRGFHELLVAGREARAAEAFAVFAERRAGDDRSEEHTSELQSL